MVDLQELTGVSSTMRGAMGVSAALHTHDGEIVLFVLHGCEANFNQEVH